MNLPTISQVKFAIEIASQLTVVVGFPIALYRYYRTTKREALDREYGTYNALDDKYIAFQKLCLRYPRLDAFDVPLEKPPVLTDEEKQQELIAFTMLMAIFERAFLMYMDQAAAIKEEQWSGWHEYIESYCRRSNFRIAWEVSGKTFDTRFQAFMDDQLHRTSPTLRSR